MSYIKINGTRSDELGLRMLGKLTHNSAKKDIDTVTILGRDGVLLIDNERLEPVDIDLDFTIDDKENLVNKLELISDWLSFKGWSDCELGWDDKFVYKVTHITDFSIKEMFHNFGQIRLSFLAQPFKYALQGLQANKVTSGTVISNTGNVVAKPLLNVSGDGEMTITINGRTTYLTNVQEGVVLDSESRQIYYRNESRWGNLVRKSDDDFPYLDKGDNTIEFTGVTSVEIVPRWRVKL